jgi:serine/threonine-protein kinase
MFPSEPAPETIRAYRVLRRLPEPGAAVVYLGRLEGPHGFQRICELKLVQNVAEGDARYAEELAREASICARLNHPAIVRMFDFFEHGDKLVLVLEHVEGASLERLLEHLDKRGQKLGDAAAFFIAHRVAGALAHAHAHRDEHGALTPVVHRHLRPDNVIIGWDGQVRLTGFGLGKILGRTPDTVAGVVKGTPGYIAPEQLRGERVTPKVDVYGMGLLLWSLLTGRRPPVDGSRPAPIARLRPDLAPAIATLIDTALSPLPVERVTTCQWIERILSTVGRAESGREDLVMRIQSAHAALEVEDGETNVEPRPTIPVQAAPGNGALAASRGLALPGLRPLARPPLFDAATARDAGSKRGAGLKAASEHANGAMAAPREVLARETWPAPAEPAEAQLRRASSVSGTRERVTDDADADEIDVEPDRDSTAELVEALLVESAPRMAPRVGMPPPPRTTPVPSPVAPEARDEPRSPASTRTTAPPPETPRDAGGETELVFAAGKRERAARRSAAPRSSSRARPSSSTVATVAISAATATIVAAAWMAIVRRGSAPASLPAPPPGASALAPPAPVPTIAAPAAPPPRSPEPPAALEPPDISALPPGYGFLTVASPGSASVYLNGKAMGVVNRPFQTRSGLWYVRLALPGEGPYADWVGPGATVQVSCQGSTTIEMRPVPGRL